MKIICRLSFFIVIICRIILSDICMYTRVISDNITILSEARASHMPASRSDSDSDTTLVMDKCYNQIVLW